MNRKNVLQQISDKIFNLKIDHPIRVAIDGITASGKTTFAKDLEQELLNRDIFAIRVSLDGFHNPKIRRYQKGRQSPEGYYYDAYNYDDVIKYLLSPLGPKGDLRFRSKSFDLKEDTCSLGIAEIMPKSGVLIVDGSFSLRSKLFPYWDFSLYLSVDEKIALTRTGIRDKSLFGPKEKAIAVTKNRYHAAHRIHNENEKPWLKSNLTINNNDPLSPSIVNIIRKNML